MVNRRVLILGILVAVAPAAAQDFRLIATDKSAVELPYEFTQLAQVFELPDGRVIVLDRGDAMLRVADLRTGVSARLGRVGSGPGEYRAPQSLIPLGGDSVALLDLGSDRLTVIRADGTLGGTVSPRPGTGGERGPSVRSGDGRGAFFGEASQARRNRGGTLVVGDSVPIVRWLIGSAVVDTIAMLYRPQPEGAIVGASGVVITRPWSTPALASVSTWVAGPGPRVALVYAEPFAVVFVEGGRRRGGAPIPYRRNAMTDSVKSAYLAERAGPGTAVIVGRDGSVSTARMPGPSGAPPAWAAEVPPFRGNGFIAFAPDGSLWIQRTTFGREGARYDVIGPDGALVDRVRLPDGHRVVGFGRDGMYVVRRDADDLEFLQRHPLLG